MTIALLRSLLPFHHRRLLWAALCTMLGGYYFGGAVAEPNTAGSVSEVALAENSPKRAYIKEAPIALETRPLVQPLSGKVVYDETRTARVFSPINGRVVSALPTLGTAVASGDKLLELDSPDLATAQSDRAKANADFALAKKSYERASALYTGRALAHKDLEQAEDDLARAQSEQQRTAQHLENLRVRPGQGFGRFELRAPIGGTVTERNVTPGLEVQVGMSTPLLVISDTIHLWLLVDVFEKDLRFVHPGLNLDLVAPAYPGEKFKATVDFIGKIVDDSSRTIKVRARVTNPDGRLLPGMYATVNLYGREDSRAIIVPLTALYTEGDSDWIYLKLPNGHYVRHAIVTGLRLKDRAVIERGLKVGDIVVTEGALLLRAEEVGK